MRKFLVSIFLGLTLVLGGCKTTDFIATPVDKSATIMEKAQAAINQAKVTWTAVAQGAIEDRKAGVYTDQEWFDFKVKMNEIKDYIEKAQMYHENGETALSANRLELANTALKVIQAELIKQKNKEQQ